jgi:hypothetical protein
VVVNWKKNSVWGSTIRKQLEPAWLVDKIIVLVEVKTGVLVGVRIFKFVVGGEKIF